MDMSWLFNTPIAHRGLWDVDNPENSLGAYQKAIDGGYNIEIDVHLLPDGDFAVFHDGNLVRVCGEEIKINALKGNELHEHKLLNKNGETTEFYIPTLQEVLDLVNGRVGLLIEMKDFTNSKGACEKLYNYLKNYEGNYAIQSFGGPALAWWRKNTKDIPIGILSFKGANVMLPCWKHSVNPDFHAFDIKGLPDWYVKRRQKKGIMVLSWTIRTQELFEKCMKVGVDNVIFETIRPKEYRK